MRYRFTIYSKIEKLDSLYRWLEAKLNRRKLDIDLVQRVLFVSQELATNSILHGNKKISTRKVYIALSITPKRVILKISDDGNGIFRLPSKKHSTKLDYLEECGRGLKLAVLMSDRIMLHRGVLRINFNLK